MISSDTIYIQGQDLALSKSLLEDAGYSENTIESAVRRKQIRAIKRGVYSFASLGAWQERVLEYLGYGSVEALRAALLAQRKADKEAKVHQVVHSLPEMWSAMYEGKDELWFGAQLAGTSVSDPGRKAKDMAQGMAIFRFIDSLPNKKAVKMLTGLESREDLIKSICVLLKGSDDAAGLDLYQVPKSYDRLRGKYYEWKKAQEAGKDAREVLLSGKLGNDNRTVADELHLSVIKEVYLDPSKPDKVFSWEKYRYIMEREYHVQPVGVTRFKQLVSTREMKVLEARIREGSLYFESHVAPFHTRKNCQYALSLVTGDGWVPGRSVKWEFNGKKGQSAMNVWYWMDWKTKAILGFRISPAESSEDIRLSFRDTINLTGFCPGSVMLDKKWEKQADIARMFEKLGVFVQEKAAYSPNQNIIERYNKERNKIHRQLDSHWVNMTPGTSRQNRHNEEHLRGAKAMEYAEFFQMIMQIFQVYNHSPVAELGGISRWQAMEQSEKKFAKELDPLTRTWAFGQTKDVTMRNFRVRIEIASKKYDYLVPVEDQERLIRLNLANNKVRVYYDEAHMDTVDIYQYDPEDDANDLYLCTLESAEAYAYNVAVIERDAQDWQKFAKNQARKDKVKEMMQKAMDEKDEILEKSNFDRASVHAVSQEKYKEAMSQAVAQMYAGYYEDQERGRGQKVKVKASAPVPTMDLDTKLAKLKEQLNNNQ